MTAFSGGRTRGGYSLQAPPAPPPLILIACPNRYGAAGVHVGGNQWMSERYLLDTLRRMADHYTRTGQTRPQRAVSASAAAVRCGDREIRDPRVATRLRRWLRL